MKKVLKKFGKYLLLDLVAQGGMAEIFRAWAPSVDGGGRLIVLKCVQPDYGEDPDFLQMFRSEIRVTMGLNHPNIVQLYDFGEFDGRPFIAMEYVEGKNLKQFIATVFKREKTMAPEVAAYIISQAAAGLHYAHGFADRSTGKPLNIVHRDISPQNLLVSYEGNVKIIDFGIAKAAGIRQATRSGVIKGKPSYLSPEQIAGATLDGRSDVFSLGAVLWETLTGKKLFAGDSDLAAIKQIEECDKTVKPPSAFNASVPPELDQIVLKALTKDPNQRIKSAEELQRVLHRFVYSFTPDFDPSYFTKYLQKLFEGEIKQEQQAIQRLNAEGKHLFDEVEKTVSNKKEEPRELKRSSGSVLATENLQLETVNHSRRPKSVREVKTGRESSTKKSRKGKSGGGGSKILLPVLTIAALFYFFPGIFPKSLVEKSEKFGIPVHKTRLAQPTSPTNVPLSLQFLPSGGSVQVFINDETVNPSGIEVRPGSTFHLRVLKQGFKPFDKEITVSQNSDSVVTQVVLEPNNYGTLKLNTTPTAEAQLVSNGLTWLTPTPIASLKLPPGRYQVQLVNRLLGMKKNLTFEIIPGKTVLQDVNLDVVQ